MTPLDQIAPAFVEMAHSIVWASVATVDADGRPRSRILHPIWEWDGTDLFGWIATVPTPAQAGAPRRAPRDVGELLDPQPRHLQRRVPRRVVHRRRDPKAVWDKFANGPEPVGYDPTIIPMWKDGPTSRSSPRCG